MNLPTSDIIAPSAQTSKISVKDFNFYYGKFHALKNINLDIPAHQVTAFIGPSGCGKSTLLRSFNRMYDLYNESHTTGKILLDGKDILGADADVNLLRAKVGMVFQKPTPFPMSIYDNIAFGVKLYEKLSKADMDERVEWALKKAALWTEVKDKLKQSGNSLSGGQQQRLCIARAAACRPEVLLLDEPTSALDPELVGEVLDTIKKAANEGYTMLLVSHEMSFVRNVATRVIFLDGGKILEDGTPREVFGNPKNERVKEFFTKINRMEEPDYSI